MECNTLSYQFSVVSTPLDPEERCNPSDSLMKPFYENKFPSQVTRNLIEVKYNISNHPTDYCKRNLQYRAEVIFRMATDTMPVTVISRRLSFFDKMSAFGQRKYLMITLFVS